MESHFQQSITGIQQVIRQKQEELASLMKAVNTLCQVEGVKPIYLDVDRPTETTISAIRRDQWYGQPLSTAIRSYLQMRRASNLGPATVNEIHDALISGGYAFETKDAENAKRGLRISLRKNSALFHRLPDGAHYGMIEWYPEAKARKEREPEESEEADAEPPEKPSKVKAPKVKAAVRKPAPKESPEHDRDRTSHIDRGASDEELPTLEAAIREAIEAAIGEFTKGDLLAWIDAQYPELNAINRKASVFTTITRLRHDLGVSTVREGKGGEPTVYKRMSEKGVNGQHI